MVVAHLSAFSLANYSPLNLKTWTHASGFTFPRNALGLQYECPNPVRIPVPSDSTPDQNDKYILTVSVTISAIPGSPAGGSTIQYLRGTFNDTHFVAVDSVTRFLKFGKESFAARFFSGIPEGEDVLLLALGANLQYTSLMPPFTNIRRMLLSNTVDSFQTPSCCAAMLVANLSASNGSGKPYVPEWSRYAYPTP